MLKESKKMIFKLVFTKYITLDLLMLSYNNLHIEEECYSAPLNSALRCQLAQYYLSTYGLKHKGTPIDNYLSIAHLWISPQA